MPDNKAPDKPTTRDTMTPQTDDFYGEQTEEDVLFEMRWFLDHTTPEQAGPLPDYLVAQIEDFARRGYDMSAWEPYLHRQPTD